MSPFDTKAKCVCTHTLPGFHTLSMPMESQKLQPKPVLHERNLQKHQLSIFHRKKKIIIMKTITVLKGKTYMLLAFYLKTFLLKSK